MYPEARCGSGGSRIRRRCVTRGTATASLVCVDDAVCTIRGLARGGQAVGAYGMQAQAGEVGEHVGGVNGGGGPGQRAGGQGVSDAGG